MTSRATIIEICQMVEVATFDCLAFEGVSGAAAFAPFSGDRIAQPSGKKVLGAQSDLLNILQDTPRSPVSRSPIKESC